MSAGKSRSRRHRDRRDAAISVVVRVADVRRAWGHSLGVNLQVGAPLGCRAVRPSGGGGQAQGA